MLARAPTTDAMSPATPEAMRHGWHRLAVRAALMSFASISTDLYLPAMPAMGHALDASAGSVEWTVSGYLIGISLGQLLGGQSATGSGGGCRLRPASFYSRSGRPAARWQAAFPP